jgi:hypothetical protein
MITSIQETSYQKRFFSNLMISLPILDELKNLGFGGDEEKFMKLKRLEP